MLYTCIWTDLRPDLDYYIRCSGRIFKGKLDSIKVDSRTHDNKGSLIELNFDIIKPKDSVKTMTLYGILKLDSTLDEFEESDLYEKSYVYKDLDSCIKDTTRCVFSVNEMSKLHELYSLSNDKQKLKMIINVSNAIEMDTVAYEATLDGIITKSKNPRIIIGPEGKLDIKIDPLTENERYTFESALTDLEVMYFG